MYSTLIENKRDRRAPEDSGVWTARPREFRHLPPPDARHFEPMPAQPVAPVAVAWIIVVTLFVLPYALLGFEEGLTTALFVAVLAPAFGVLWIAQFRPVRHREAVARAGIWLGVALMIAGVADGNPWIVIAGAPLFGGFGILGAFVMSLLLNPGNE